MKRSITSKQAVSFCSTLGLVATTAFSSACGIGVPIEIRIDEFQFVLDMDAAMGDMHTELMANGILPPGTTALPELWPETLPDIDYTLRIVGEPMAVDLTPPKGAVQADKYKKINSAKKAVQRIEINRVYLRVEQSNLSIGVPALDMEVADTVDANPDDRFSWLDVGQLSGSKEAEYIGDIEMDWLPGGESIFNYQLSDDVKEMGARTVGNLQIDTTVNRDMPRGKAIMRLIVVATFFIAPEKAL